MNIALCGDCGWLGSVIEISSLAEDDLDVNENIAPIIESNNMTCKCCPTCQSTKLYYKVAPDFSTLQTGVQTGPQTGYVRARAEGPVRVAEAPATHAEVVEEFEEPEERDEIPAEDVDEDIVADILASAEDPEERKALAADLAAGLGETAQDVVANIAGVDKKELKEPVKKAKKKKKVAKKKKKDASPSRPPVRHGSYTCDDCGKSFTSKTETAKCPGCMNAFMKKYVG